MNFSIEPTALATALDMVAPATASCTTLQAVYKHVRIDAPEANGALVRFTCSNGLLSIQWTAVAVVRAPGHALVLASQLRDLAGLLSGTVVVSAGKSDTITFKTSGMTHALKRLADEDAFPDVHPTPGSPATLSAADVARLIQACKHAVADKQTAQSSPVLGGMHLRFRAGAMSAAASNRLVLAGAMASCRAGEGVPACTLPPGAYGPMATLAKAAGECDVEITADAGSISLKTPTGWMRATLISSVYPDVSAIIPRSPVASLTAPRAQFILAARMAEALGASALVIDVPDTGKPTVCAVQAEVGQGVARLIDAEHTGCAFKVILDSADLKGCIDALRGEDIVIEWTAANKPVRVVAKDDKSAFGVLSPIASKEILAAVKVADADADEQPELPGLLPAHAAPLKTPALAGWASPAKKSGGSPATSSNQVGAKTPAAKSAAPAARGSDAWLREQASRLHNMLRAGNQPVYNAAWSKDEQATIDLLLRAMLDEGSAAAQPDVILAGGI